MYQKNRKANLPVIQDLFSWVSRVQAHKEIGANKSDSVSFSQAPEENVQPHFSIHYGVTATIDGCGL